MSSPAASPFVVGTATVASVQRISPSFVRITFGGADLADVGTPGRVFDQRIKVIFPGPSGTVPVIAGGGENWYSAWLDLPESERGSMRTYSIRELIAGPLGTRVVVDFVLHLEPGLTGPASRWANQASTGDQVLLVGPRRGREGGGIEYAPGDAATVLLAGDETAAPAIARILEDAGPGLRGAAFIEVPCADDVLAIDAPPGVTVRWLVRDGLPHGETLIPAVLEHLGDQAELPLIEDLDSEEPVWETRDHSGLGEDLGTPPDHTDRYFWIAGESAVVTTLRRHLVSDLGIDRHQVAFMGYWRRGVAMRG